jgi:hypothetical protein
MRVTMGGRGGNSRPGGKPADAKPEVPKADDKKTE